MRCMLGQIACRIYLNKNLSLWLEKRKIHGNLQITMSLSYMPLATNNLNAVLRGSKGARCVSCLGFPQILPSTEVCDISTIVDCGVDAVVPASSVPNEEVLNIWHNQGFRIPITEH